MGYTLLYDVEADGFLEEATRIHCIVAVDVRTGRKYQFYGDTTVPGDHGSVECGVQFLMGADELIAHNQIGYDLPLIKKLTGYEYKGVISDTLVWSRSLNPVRERPYGLTGKAGPHSVEAWALRFGMRKVEHNDWAAFSMDMLNRCLVDVDIQFKIYSSLLREAGVSFADLTPGEQVVPDYLRMEDKVAVIVQRQVEAGWKVDRELLVKHLRFLQNAIGKFDAWLSGRLPNLCVPEETRLPDKERKAALSEYRYVSKPFLKSGGYSAQVHKVWPELEQHNIGPDFKPFSVGGPFSRVSFRQINWRSDKELKKFLFMMGWKPTEWNTSKKGKNKGNITGPKLTEDSFTSIKGKVGKVVAQLLKCRHREGVLKGWLEALGEDGRIHGGCNPQGAETGRATHSLLANVPSPEKRQYFAKQMRSVFIASGPDRVLVSCDSDQDQLRKFAIYLNDDEFTHALLHGKKEDGTDVHTLNWKKIGLPTRGHAKNYIYAYIFGMGAAKAGGMIGGGEKEGKKLLADTNRAYPTLPTLRKDLKHKLDTRGYLLGLDGRKLFTDSAHKALCLLCQGGEAITMKRFIVLMDEAIKREGIDAYQVMWYHDEVTWDCAEADADRLLQLSLEMMVFAGDCYQLPVPLKGSAKKGKSWLEVH
jgi:DNA polymerase I